MPDLIIKPTNTSGNKVIIQDQGAVTRLQTDDAGITITAPTIANMANCTFPSGMLVQSKVLFTETGGSSIANDTTTFASVVGGSFTTKLASSASMIRIWWETNRIHSQENTSQFDMTLRQSSSSTTHADGDSMHNTTRRPEIAINDPSSGQCSYYLPMAYPFVSGTDSNSTAYVGNISSWSAGETLYWRLFQRKESGPNNIFAYLEDGRMEIRLEEITI